MRREGNVGAQASAPASLSRPSVEPSSSASGSASGQSGSELSAGSQPLAMAADVAAVYNRRPLKSVITSVHGILKTKLLPRLPCDYTIYTANSLSELADHLRVKLNEKMKKASRKGLLLSDERSRGLRTIRYLLTTNDVLLFATEGVAPPQYIMPGSCKPGESSAHCAGNVVFNEDYSKVSIVTNSSGDFLPEPVLLKRVFAVMLALHDQGKLTLEDPLQIEHEGKRGGYTVTLDVLHEYVHAEFTAVELAKFVTDNQSAQRHSVHYEPVVRSVSRVHNTLMRSRRRLAFQFDEPYARADQVGLASTAGLFSDLPPVTKEEEQQEQAVDDAVAQGQKRQGTVTADHLFRRPPSSFKRPRLKNENSAAGQTEQLLRSPELKPLQDVHSPGL